MDELLRLVPTVGYGDSAPADRRGGALHLPPCCPPSPPPSDIRPPPRSTPISKACQRAFGAARCRIGHRGARGRPGLLEPRHAPRPRALSAFADERKRQSASHRYLRSKHHCGGHGRIRYRNLPGLTAMAGYTQLEPASHKLIQLIQFKDALAPKPANPHIPVPPMVDPLDLQREETVFEKLAAQEVRVTSSGLPKFSKSPLTEAALRGTDYQGNVTPRDRVLAAARASRTPGLTYLYIRDADKVGRDAGRIRTLGGRIRTYRRPARAPETQRTQRHTDRHRSRPRHGANRHGPAD